MNAKTHVSILQEMMVKKGSVPNYDLIHDGGGTHMNTFVYRVSCDGFVATGTGRCKKDAKHTAAKKMLDTIAAARSYPQLPATPADSPVRTPLPEQLPPPPKVSPDEPFLNAIGDLKTLCAVNELQDPEYNMISDVGPPHARIFTYQCVVSTFREEGRAMTKKQAKHEASKKMLDRLLEVFADVDKKNSVYEGLRKRDTKLGVDKSTHRAQSVYSSLQKSSTKKINLGVKLFDYHLKLKRSFNDDTIPTKSEVLSGLESILKYMRDNNECRNNEDTNEYLVSVRSKLEEFLSPMNVDFSTIVYSNEGETMLFLKINCTPDIVEVVLGDNVVDMEVTAILNALETFQLLVQ